MKNVLPVAAAIACCFLSACADIRGASTNFTQLAATDNRSSIRIARDVEIELSTGYHRTLRQGTVWLETGNIAAGRVYKPRDTVFSVEGTNVHEAYLVLSGSQLVGYYLPVEHTFINQSPPIDIPTQ